MPHEPKRRHSVARKGKRRASIKLKTTAFVSCSNCGAPVAPHTVCGSCGFYKGQQFVKTKAKATVTRV